MSENRDRTPSRTPQGASGQDNHYEVVRVIFCNKWTTEIVTLEHSLLLFAEGGNHQKPMLLGVLEAGEKLAKDPAGFWYGEIFIQRAFKTMSEERFFFVYSVGLDKDWKWSDKINSCWMDQGSYSFKAPEPMAANRSATAEEPDVGRRTALRAFQSLVNIGSPMLSSENTFAATKPEKRPMEPNGLGCYHIAPVPENLDAMHNGMRLLLLWKLELPAIIDMHTHIMSNYCAPIQAVCDKMGAVGNFIVEGPQALLTIFAPWKAADSGSFGFRSTKQIGEVAHEQAFKSFGKRSEFPQYANKPIHSFNALPMDMMFAHYAGYYGVPMLKIAPSFFYGGKWVTAGVSQENEEDKEELDVIRSMAFSSKSSLLGDTKLPSWCFKAEKLGSNQFLCRWTSENYILKLLKPLDFMMHQYEPWPEQVRCHVSFVKNHPYTALSFYHLDPRRYRRDPENKLVDARADIPNDYHGFQRELSSVWARLVQTPESSKGIDKAFVGIKMYTSQGYAPYDPFLRDLQTKIYRKCSASGIPILTHCSPQGFYNIDREHYYDYLRTDGKLAEGKQSLANSEVLTLRIMLPRVVKLIRPGDEHVTSIDLTQEEIQTRFGGSRAKMLALEKDKFKATIDDTQLEYREPINERECIYWFNNSFVAPRAWAAVVKDHPKLKLCLAHFAGSEHLDTSAEKIQAKYIPFESWYNKGGKQRTFWARDDGTIDLTRTHPYISQLIELIQPENRVFVDLSYTILNATNVDGFKRLFAWAEKHKPVFLERVLWGSDWPLISMESDIGGDFLRSLGRWFLRVSVSTMDDIDDRLGNHLGNNLKDCFAKLADLGVDDIFKVFALNQQAFLGLFKESSTSPHVREIGLEYWIRFTLLNPMQYLNYKVTCEALRDGALQLKESNNSDDTASPPEDLFPQWLTNGSSKNWVEEISNISATDTDQSKYNQDKLALFLNAIGGK